MTHAERILELLQDESDPIVDQAVADALIWSQRNILSQLAGCLLRRDRHEGILGLIRHCHRVDPSTRKALIAATPRHPRAIREASTDQSGAVRDRAIDLIRDANDATLAYLLTAILRRDDSERVARAASALCDMVQRHVDPPAESDTPAPPTSPPAAALPEAMAHLEAAVGEAVAAFGHHRRDEVLHAMLLMAHRPALNALPVLTQIRHPVIEPLRRLLEKAETELVRRALLPMLTVPTLRSAAQDGIRAAATLRNLEDVLVNGHLLIHPAIAEAIRAMRDAIPTMPDDHAITTMAPSQRRWLGPWFDALPMTVRDKAGHLSRLLETDDVTTRAAAIRTLINLSNRHTDESLLSALELAAGDADASLAHAAARQLRRRSASGQPRRLLAMVDSPHPAVRALAAQSVAPVGFDRLWRAWPRLSFGQQIAAGRALIKLDPRFHIQLGRKLEPPHRDDRLRAIQIIRALNQTTAFEKPLIAMADSEDEVVASAAVRALGASESSEAIDALERALRHRDSRVRANAVEALDQLQQTRHVEQLVDMSEHDDNRPRANAIGALMSMRVNDALAALADMLHDPRPRHRASGLWLVEHIGLVNMARLVAELAIADSDTEVRRRAGEVMDHIIQSLKFPIPAATDQTDAADDTTATTPAA